MRKMIRMFRVKPEDGGPGGSLPEHDMFYEKASIEQETINLFESGTSSGVNSFTLNLTNFLSDYDLVMQSPGYRTSEKESKGAENLMAGKPRYYPAAYINAMKEQIIEPEPDEPDPVNPPVVVV